MQCFPNFIPRVDARLHLDATTDFRIKGRCWNALRALSAIPGIVLFPSKPSTISAPMSSPTKTPHHRHTPSNDSNKYEDPVPGRNGEPSAETFYVRDDSITIYPNNWARIRLATDTMYHSPDAYVISQRDHTRACRRSAWNHDSDSPWYC